MSTHFPETGAAFARINPASIMKSPAFIALVVMAVLFGYLLPSFADSSEATHQEYRLIEMIAHNTQCEETKARIRDAMADGVLTSLEVRLISGHSTSIGCDRAATVASIQSALQ